MRNIIFLLMICPLVGIAQNIDSTINQRQLIGVWQIGTPKLGDALLAHYQFFENGEFIYNFSQYDDAQRVLALKGHYRSVGNKLFISIQSRVELTGGYFTKGSPGFQASPFVLEGGTIETFNQVDTTNQRDPFILSVTLTNKKGKIVGLKIDNNKYYKLTDNPLKYGSPDRKEH